MKLSRLGSPRGGHGFASIVIVVCCAVLIGSADADVGRADSDYVVNPDGWVISGEEQALCARALRDCTPIVAGIATQQREADAQARRLHLKLRSQQQKSLTDRAELELRIESLEAEIDALKNSTSWWLTSPLRYLHALVFGG